MGSDDEGFRGTSHLDPKCVGGHSQALSSEYLVPPFKHFSLSSETQK